MTETDSRSIRVGTIGILVTARRLIVWGDVLRWVDTIGLLAFWATILGGIMKWMAGNR